jgi:hypothetical protein
MIPTDDRIARLTELAQRVWAPRSLYVEQASEFQSAAVRGVDDDQPWLLVEDHPRALDALEAALLVLAAEPDMRDAALRGCGNVIREQEAKLAAVREAAEAWEADARRLNTTPCLPASTLMDCREEILSIVGSCEDVEHQQGRESHAR